MVVEEHYHNDGGGSNAIGWIVLLIIVVLIGWFLLRGGFNSRPSNINVTLPDVTNDGGSAGGTGTSTGGGQ